MDDNNKQFTLESFEEIVIDFGEICRFCLTETKSNISIKDKCLTEETTDKEEDSIYNFVTKLRIIKMEGAENFPSLVCENCYELIKLCYNFSQVCQRSDNLLRDCYEQTLKETKAKLIYKKDIESPKSDKIQNESYFSLNDISIKLENFSSNELEDLKSGPELDLIESVNLLKACNRKVNSLTDRLKEAQSKLAEDILRSNDLMLSLPKSNELREVEKPMHACPQCSLKFSNQRALNFHYVATHGQIKKFRNLVKFQCKKCVKSFSEQERLIRHYRIIHKIPETELVEEDLNHKVKKSVRTGSRKFFCLHCVPYKVFQTREQLVEHLEECHKINEKESEGVSKSYACARCETETTFPSRNTLNRHLRAVHGIKDSEITWNDMKFISKDSEDSQKSNAKLLKVFVCTDCSPPVSFPDVESCVRHKMENHEKQLENISLKELTAFCADSLDVLQQTKEEGSGFRFKVLCKNCEPPLKFTSASEFVNHMYSLHDESTLENWVIESKPLTVMKTDDQKKENSWKCSECPASYFRKQSLYYHMREKHNKPLHQGEMKCPEPKCSESFTTNRQLIQHGISVHQKYFAHFHKVFKKKILEHSSEEENRVKDFECDICQKKYTYKTSLKKHILKAHLGKCSATSVVCSYCGKTLSNKLNLKSHIEFVHEALFVSCPICKKEINFRTIGKHYKTHQTNSDLVDSKNLFLCNLCGKILKSKRSFEDHQKLHKNIRDQLCDICGSGFTTKKFLYLHKKSHEGLQRKVFECHLCDKVFSGRHTLNRHLLTHSGEKNFICEICSKCFYTLQELNRHVRYHKKEYRFDCQLCDMRFLDKSRFRHHMMRHRNVRPHKCQFCDKMFIVRGKMNLHMAAKHNVEIQSTKGVWKDPKTYVPLDDLL